MNITNKEIERRIIRWRKTHFPNRDAWWYAQNLLGDVVGWPEWYSKLSGNLSKENGGKVRDHALEELSDDCDGTYVGDILMMVNCHCEKKEVL